MVTKTISVLDPTVKPDSKEIPMPPRVHELNDKAIGFLWNQKSNGDVLLLRIKEQLGQRFHFTRANLYPKSSTQAMADADIIEELTHTSDLVINAIGD